MKICIYEDIIAGYRTTTEVLCATLRAIATQKMKEATPPELAATYSFVGQRPETLFSFGLGARLSQLHRQLLERENKLRRRFQSAQVSRSRSHTPIFP